MSEQIKIYPKEFLNKLIREKELDQFPALAMTFNALFSNGYEGRKGAQEEFGLSKNAFDTRLHRFYKIFGVHSYQGFLAEVDRLYYEKSEAPSPQQQTDDSPPVPETHPLSSSDQPNPLENPLEWLQWLVNQLESGNLTPGEAFAKLHETVDEMGTGIALTSTATKKGVSQAINRIFSEAKVDFLIGIYTRFTAFVNSHKAEE